jgi:serine/threonine-protein kinase
VLGSASSYDPDATEVLDAGIATPQGAAPKGEVHGGTNDLAELPKIPIDKRSDVYSIGATLFHLYTGTRLDKADKKVLKASTSEGYLYILNKALQENPRSRFASAGEMLKALNSIHQKEKAYRCMVLRQSIVRIVLLFGIVAGAGLISLGLQKKQEEKEALYASYIEQMAAYDPAGSEEGFEEIYQNAIGLKPDAIDAYEQKAFFLYKRRAYEDAVAYVDEALQNSSVYETERVSGLYYVSGNAHYALEEYKEAADDFRNALKYDAKNPDINGDYAIALAKTGDLTGATDAAAKAEEYGIADAHLYLTRGEIEFAKGNNEEAEKYLRDCIKLTDDDYRKMCAYVTCGKAITAGGTQEDLDKGIEFLKSGLSDVGIEYKGYLMGLLAETYIQAYSQTEEEKYSNGAIDSLAEMIESGWASYSTYNNIVILCTNTGRYDDASKYIGLMEERYQDNYNVYKRKAFLELEIQKAKDEKERDFSKFAEYYEEAERLFKEQSGDKQDPEMNLLRDDLQVLKDTHWL